MNISNFARDNFVSQRLYISVIVRVARIIIQFYDQFGCQSDVKMTHTICRPLLKMCIRDCVFWITNCNKNKFLQFAIVPWKFQHLWNWHLETKKAHAFLIRFLFCLERKREFQELSVSHMHMKTIEKFFVVAREKSGRKIQFGIRRHALSVSMYARKCYRRDRYICLECYDELTSRGSDKYIIFN